MKAAVIIQPGSVAPASVDAPAPGPREVVVAVGSTVTELAVGARVAVDPSLYCFACHYCRPGHNNRCERGAAIGVTHPGAAAEDDASARQGHRRRERRRRRHQHRTPGHGPAVGLIRPSHVSRRA